MHWKLALILGLLELGGKASAQDSSTIEVVLPPNSPPGAYDSLAYVQLLRNQLPCPGRVPGLELKGAFVTYLCLALA
jgi:hypothetical protein